MNNIRIFLSTVFINIFHTELLGKHLVNLNSNKSIFLAVNISDLNIKLRTVESGFTYTDAEIAAEYEANPNSYDAVTYRQFLVSDSLFQTSTDSSDESTADSSDTTEELSEEELNEQGIYSNTIRLSIGTENIDDIIEDLEGGFQSV